MGEDFKVGDVVKVRDKTSESWEYGFVTSVDPLKAKPYGWHKGFAWKVIEHIDLKSLGKELAGKSKDSESGGSSSKSSSSKSSSSEDGSQRGSDSEGSTAESKSSKEKHPGGGSSGEDDGKEGSEH